MRIKLFSNYLPLLCLTACVWVSCSQNWEKKSGKKDHTPVMRLTTTTIEVPQSYVADVQAVQFVEVKPKVEGFVEAVLVDEGEHVKKGQVLFKLSSAELYEEVKEAQAHHKQAQAELKMAEVEVDRIKRLVEKDIISPIRLEQAMAEADVARLQVQQAKSRLQRAETNFSYTTITAPFEGYVDRIPFKVGSLVTPSSLLTSLTDVSDMFAYFKINEKEYLEYKRTQLSGIDQPEYNNLELILSDQSTYRYKGKVETVEGDFERGYRIDRFPCPFREPGTFAATWRIRQDPDADQDGERGLGSPAIHFRDSGFHLCIYGSGRWKGERTQLRAVGPPRFLLRDTGFAGPDRYRLRGCSDDHGRHDYQSRYGRWSHDPSPIGIV